MKVFIKIKFVFYEDCSLGANVIDLSKEQIEDLKKIFDAWKKADIPCMYTHKLPTDFENYNKERFKPIYEAAKNTFLESIDMENTFAAINDFMEKNELFAIAECNDVCGGISEYEIIEV